MSNLEAFAGWRSDDSDRADERRIDDVVADEWIYRPDRSVLPTDLSDLVPADRRSDVVLR